MITQELSECLVEQEDNREPQCMSQVQGCWRKKVVILPLLTGEEDNQEPRQQDLKPLPMELKYAFLEENKQCPVVISSLLTTP